MSAIIQSIAFYGELLANETEKYRSLLTGFISTVVRLKNEAAAAKVNVPEMGKALYATHARYETLRRDTPDSPEIKGRNKSQYVHGFLGISPDKKPALWNHVESVANSIRYIAAGLITENDFNLVTADGRYVAMTLASEILTKACDSFEHEAVQDAAGLLKSRPGNLTTALKGIKARFVNVYDEETKGSKTEYLSIAEMAEKEKTATLLQQTTWLDDLVKASGTAPLFAAIGAFAQNTADANAAKAVVRGLVDCQGALRSNVTEQKVRRYDDATLKGWAAEFAPPVVVTEESVKAEFAALNARIGELQDQYPALVEMASNAIEAAEREMLHTEAQAA